MYINVWMIVYSDTLHSTRDAVATMDNIGRRQHRLVCVAPLRTSNPTYNIQQAFGDAFLYNINGPVNMPSAF